MDLIVTKKTRDLKLANECIGQRIGFEQENLADVINIFIEDENLLDKTITLEFEVNSNGKKYISEFLDIDENGYVHFNVPNTLLSEIGYVEMQVVFRDLQNRVWKSNIRKFPIDRSICATDELPEPMPDILTILNHLHNDVKYLREDLSILKDNTLSKDLSILPKIEYNKEYDREEAYVYIYNNDTPSKTTVNKMLSTKIRTVKEEPIDFQVGDYIFLLELEKEGEDD